MALDSRGLNVRRDDVVAWYGRIGNDRPGVHLGIIEGFTFFGGVYVGVVYHGESEHWRTTGLVIKVKPNKILLIDDAPGSPYE